MLNASIVDGKLVFDMKQLVANLSTDTDTRMINIPALGMITHHDYTVALKMCETVAYGSRSNYSRKIEAIKFVRHALTCGLKQAKEIVDFIIWEHPHIGVQFNLLRMVNIYIYKNQNINHENLLGRVPVEYNSNPRRMLEAAFKASQNQDDGYPAWSLKDGMGQRSSMIDDIFVFEHDRDLVAYACSCDSWTKLY